MKKLSPDFPSACRWGDKDWIWIFGSFKGQTDCVFATSSPNWIIVGSVVETADTEPQSGPTQLSDQDHANILQCKEQHCVCSFNGLHGPSAQLMVVRLEDMLVQRRERRSVHSFFSLLFSVFFLRMSEGQSAGTKLVSVEFEIFGHVQGQCV